MTAPPSTTASRAAGEPIRADVAAVILAGGAATRMGGQAKALVEVDGQTVLARQLDVLRPRVSAIVLSTNEPALYAHTGLPTVSDARPGEGPLGGIAAALRRCRRPYLLVVAGDMPHLSGAVVDRLLSRRAPGVDAVALRTSAGVEPLLTLYAARCLPVIEERLAAGKRKAAGVLTDEGLVVRWIEEPELREIDPEGRSLANINTPDDL